MIKKRHIAIGDIHGCYDQLIKLLDKINYEPINDELIFLGDLIDRGPHSKCVVQFAMMFGAKCIMGNHEEKMLRWLYWNEDCKITGRKNPCKNPSPERKDQWLSLSKNELDFIKSFPYYLRLPNDWIAVHAGFEPAYSFENQKNDKLCRTRYINIDTGKMKSINDNLEQPENTVFWTERYNLQYHIIYGHSIKSYERPVVEMTNGKYLISMDTGCCFGGKLSAIILENDNNFCFHSVDGEKHWNK